MDALINLHTLFRRQLSDLYSAETQLAEALPTLRNQTSNQHLKKIFSNHIRETKKHQTRISDIADALDIDLSEDTCEAMKGLIKEAKNVTPENNKRVRDAELIADAKRIEQYEILAYDTALQFAKSLNHRAVIEKLQQTLNEEKLAADKLTVIAGQNINLESKAD